MVGEAGGSLVAAAAATQAKKLTEKTVALSAKHESARENYEKLSQQTMPLFAQAVDTLGTPVVWD